MSLVFDSLAAYAFAFLQFPDAPVEPLEGWAQIAGNEARAPRIEVRNRSQKPVRYVEIGWVVEDSAGKQYLAASVPASDPDLYLPPGRKVGPTVVVSLDPLR